MSLVPKPLQPLSIPPFLQHSVTANINRDLTVGQALCRVHEMPSFILLTQRGWACYSPHNRSQTDKATCPGSRLSYLYSCMTQKLGSSLLKLALVLCFHWQTDERVDYLEVLCLGSDTPGTLIHLVNPALARVSSPSHMVLALLESLLILGHWYSFLVTFVFHIQGDTLEIGCVWQEYGGWGGTSDMSR